MTIPISPGPFSFLAQLGQAGGEAFAAHEKDRQQKVKEAKDVLGQMIELRSKGFLTPEEFSSPQAMKIYETLGIAPVSNQPNVEETKNRDIMEFIQSRAGAAPGTPQADERAAALGLPSRATSGKVSAEVAQNKAAVPVAEVQGATAEAQLPQAGATASLEQVGKQQDALGAIADQVVSSVYNTTKKLPSPEQAYAAAQADTRAAPYKAQLTPEVIGQAVERQRRILNEEETRRLLAAAALDRANRPLAGDKLKPLPTPILTKVTDQAALLSDIDQAIDEVSAQKSAVGPIKGHLPGFVLNVTDPSGVQARGAIQRVRSANLHSLYGARLTATEIAQTNQLHPATTDTPEAALIKLRKMRERVAKHNQDYVAAIPREYDLTTIDGASGGAAPQAAAPPGDSLDAQAQDAIAKGADPEAVKKRLEELRKGKK